MQVSLEINQKQQLKLSREMKLSFQILSMPYSELHKLLNNNFIKKKSSIALSFLENFSKENNFYDYLEEQIFYLNIPKKMKENLIYCINNINSQGFLILSDLELCRQLKIGKRDLKEIFKILYELEPIGVGTHNFRECIKVQLIKKNMWVDKIEDVLNNLEYVASGKEEDLLKKIQITKEELEFYLKKIKTCNPKPSRGFCINKNLQINQYSIVPDFYLYIKNKNIELEENSSWKNNFYHKNNINDKNMELLKRCIEKRMDTLKSILEYMIGIQKNYFINDDFLITLHEEEIANALNLSISTISRAIQDKYIWTKKGLISFKELFCYSGENEIIKDKLEKILKEEDKRKPYSDLQLSKKIEKELNFKIARRTITKYRKDLGYSSSSKRKIK